MKQNFLKNTRFLTISCLVASLFLAANVVAKEKQELPEIDKDGLHLIKGTKVAAAYAKPGARLSDYSKVMLLDCFVQYKENWERDYNRDAMGLQGRVSDRDMEDAKTKLAAAFRQEFSETLVKDGHEVVDTMGPGVLLLRPAIINLDPAAPDLMRASRGNTWVRSAGSMTLYMELYDSDGSTLIGRVADPQADPDNGARVASSVTNKAAAERIIRDWAKLLSKRLSEVQTATSQ